MKDTALMIKIARDIGMTVRDDDSSFDRQLLADKINELINTDFQKLISILYRMDINETKLRLLLQDNPASDAGLIIANLMIERQAQKIKSRKVIRNNEDIPDDEKW